MAWTSVGANIVEIGLRSIAQLKKDKVCQVLQDMSCCLNSLKEVI